jgi:hypothetical protein
MMTCLSSQIFGHEFFFTIFVAQDVAGIKIYRDRFFNISDDTQVINGIRAGLMGSSCGDVTLRERLLGFNSATLLTWTTLKICLAEYDLKCFKRF